MTTTVTITREISVTETVMTFDQQSSTSVIGANPIRITPVKHWNSLWAWWAHCMAGGTTPTFQIAKADHYNMVANERLCCWAQAADTDTWYDFDNVTIGASDLEFSMDTPFPAGVIYVAALPIATTVNVNTAPAEVLSAVIPRLSLSRARQLVAERTTGHFESLDEFKAHLMNTERENLENIAIASQFFFAHGEIRLEQTVYRIDALLQRQDAQWPRIVWQRQQ